MLNKLMVVTSDIFVIRISAGDVILVAGSIKTVTDACVVWQRSGSDQCSHYRIQGMDATESKDVDRKRTVCAIAEYSCPGIGRQYCSISRRLEIFAKALI